MRPRPHPTVAERVDEGRAWRERVKRSELGHWTPAPDRDPLGTLTLQERSRVPELVPLRHERMGASPFAFFRGAAAVFADDIAPTPRTGLIVQLCGDAHLMNFGAFASPERSFVFDLNDFDETLPGPFEWDVKRLAASFEVAARSIGADDRQRVGVQRALASTYASTMAELAGMDHIDVWYQRLTLEEILRRWGDEVTPDVIDRLRKNAEKARGKDRLRALDRLTVAGPDGTPRFRSDPPLLQPAAELMDAADADRVVDILHQALRRYRQTLQPDRRSLLERYQLVDLARKVVGVGSVGTRCWVALLVGRQHADPLVLQVKEAQASVLERHLGPSRYGHHGRRVVEGQRMMQSASDILLGWERITGLDGEAHDHYFRQLWDWKASADVESMSPQILAVYARICAATLARGHARTGDSVAIASYVGRGRALGRAMTEFAAAYADQTERDHDRCQRAWRSSVSALTARGADGAAGRGGAPQTRPSSQRS